MELTAIKILLPTTLSFIIGILLTPRLTAWMYRKKMWKKQSRESNDGITNEDFKKIHNANDEVSTPRLGGIIIWASVVATIALMWLISKVIPSDFSTKMDFYSRSQTLVPLAAFLFGALIGLLDDLLQISGRGSYAGDAIRYRRIKIAAVVGIGAIIGAWFYFKLGMTTIALPLSGGASIALGWLFIPVFIVVLLAAFSTSIIDGLDGLAGGVLAIVFAAYAAIAFGKHMVDIAALCGVISGATLAFLWFNIPPARFYMGETGILALLVALTVVAFLTDTVLILPLIALPLVVTSASAIIQIVSYNYFGKRRVFKIAPLHHHFRALGWSREKVVMRYWVVSTVCAILGIVIALAG